MRSLVKQPLILCGFVGFGCLGAACSSDPGPEPVPGGSAGTATSSSAGSAALAGAPSTGGSLATSAGSPPAAGGMPGVAGAEQGVAGSAGGSSAGGSSAGGSSAGGPGLPPDDGELAAKPLMGWSSWSSTTGNITEAKVKAAADYVAANLSPFGYRYINIDDGWYSGFDANGRWKPDTGKFPNGFKGAADYVHSKGLKIGIYLIPGVNDSAISANAAIEGTNYHVEDIVTNAAGNTNKKAGQTAKAIDFSKPGAVEYVQGYANLLASWGVDFIKMDFVGPGGGGGNSDNQAEIKQWRAALDKSGRKIWLELSNMLDISAIDTWSKYSNGWRVANDVECYCDTLTNWAHVIRVINGLPPFVKYAKPGHWNDLDSLELGSGSKDGLTADERQSMFSFWAINAAPLYIGADVSSALDPDDLKILTNKEVIAVNQAAIPAQALSTGTTQVWYAKQPDGSVVVGLFNFGTSTTNLSVSFSAVGAASAMKVRDLVSQMDLGMSSGSFSAMLPTHASRLIRLSP